MPKTPSDLLPDPPVSEDHTAEDAGGGTTAARSHLTLSETERMLSFLLLSCQTKINLFVRTS